VVIRRPAERPKLIALAVLLSAFVVAGLAYLFMSQKQSVDETRTSPPGAKAGATNDICANSDQVRALVSEFIDGYDKGQAGLADRYFATAPDFQWYSEQPLREGAPAYDRTTLEAYLRQRHAAGDQLSVVSVEFNSVRGGIGNFGFVLDRGGTRLPSKGALDCASRKFIVWSIGPNAGPVP
jgi:hypothetical protein